MRERTRTNCRALLLLSALWLFASCVNTKGVTYFNDVAESATIASAGGLEPVIQPNDLLSINVSSLDPKATVVFNMPNLTTSPTGQVAPNMIQASGYLVNQDGVIRFPMLGEIRAQGKTKKQLEEEISQKLSDKKLLFEPIVNIRYLNFRVTVLGEVARPGVIPVPSEQISILEAIGAAGDLTVYGRRENVILIRQEGEHKNVQRLNLNSSEVLKSPYFFLKSNDVVYVEPGKARAASGTRTQQLLPSILSGISIAVVVITALIR